MNTIWKSILGPEEIQSIGMPEGAKMLCAHQQDRNICIWYQCDPDANMVKRQIIVVGTGWRDIAEGHYVGTAFISNGLVFHVFDGGEQ